MKQSTIRRWYPLFLGTIVIVLGAIMATGYFINRQHTVQFFIADDIKQLSDIFAKIDDECGIIGFERARMYIDFLTVEKFIGSEIGGMKLKKPAAWHGPYIAENPTIQGKQYVILTTKTGSYIVPDNGVSILPNTVIGTDIMLTPESDIDELIHQKILAINGAPLAAKILTGSAKKSGIDLKTAHALIETE